MRQAAFCSGNSGRMVRDERSQSVSTPSPFTITSTTTKTAVLQSPPVPNTTNNSNNMVVVVRRRQRGMMSRSKENAMLTDSSAHITVAPDQQYSKSPSASSLRSSNSSKHHKASLNSVCFAHDYGSPDQAFAAPPPLTPLEYQAAFYTKDDLNRFDKDRALTVLLYRTRKSHNVPWDDNLHSLRGLEESLQSSKSKSSSHAERSKKERRNVVIGAVLKEQERLKTPAGARELAAAAQAMIKASSNNNNNNKQQQPVLMTERDVYDELLRGVSCSLSKVDKQRAIGLAQKDEKIAGRHWQRTSSRRMLASFKTKLSSWVSTSNNSLAESVKSATSTNSNYHHHAWESGGDASTHSMTTDPPLTVSLCCGPADAVSSSSSSCPGLPQYNNRDHKVAAATTASSSFPAATTTVCPAAAAGPLSPTAPLATLSHRLQLFRHQQQSPHQSAQPSLPEHTSPGGGHHQLLPIRRGSVL